MKRDQNKQDTPLNAATSADDLLSALESDALQPIPTAEPASPAAPAENSIDNTHISSEEPASAHIEDTPITSLPAVDDAAPEQLELPTVFDEILPDEKPAKSGKVSLRERISMLSERKSSVEKTEEQDTENGSFVDRARDAARQRRREQTRLRREYARKGISPNSTPVLQSQLSMADLRFTLILLAVSAVFLLLGGLLGKGAFALLFLLIGYLIVSIPLIIKMAKSVSSGHFLADYLLVLIASIGAFLVGQRLEAGIVMLLFSVSKLLIAWILSRNSFPPDPVAEIAPKKAVVVSVQGEERTVPPTDIEIGEYVIVRDGERIPVDGKVLQGSGTIDNSALLSEDQTQQVEKDINVLAGALYHGEAMLVEATKDYDTCVISQILRVHEDAEKNVSSLESSVINGLPAFMPIAIVLILLVAFLPPLFQFGTVATWVYRALILLFLCAPSSLSVSVPLAFMGGKNRMTRGGIHVKGGETIEKLAELRVVVFDKTQTLTEGKPRVREIHTLHADFSPESCLALIAAAEQHSMHPVAKAVVAAYPGTPQETTEFEEIPGRGVRAKIGNHTLLAGNRKLMISRGIKNVPEINGTVIYLAYEGECVGAAELEDTIRPEAADAVKTLKSLGVTRTVILTGDTEEPAQKAAKEAGIDTVHSGLLPEEKASKMEFLLRTMPTDGNAAYVGCVNDLTELQEADIAVAMGVADAQQPAYEADVLITTYNLRRFADAVRIAHQTHGIAMQNMLLVFGIKSILVLLAVFGVTTMWQTLLVDLLVSAFTVLNATRMLKSK